MSQTRKFDHFFFKKSALGGIKSLDKPVKCIGGANYAQYQRLGTIIAPDGGFRMAKWAFFWTLAKIGPKFDVFGLGKLRRRFFLGSEGLFSVS